MLIEYNLLVYFLNEHKFYSNAIQGLQQSPMA